MSHFYHNVVLSLRIPWRRIISETYFNLILHYGPQKSNKKCRLGGSIMKKDDEKKERENTPKFTKKKKKVQNHSDIGGFGPIANKSKHFWIGWQDCRDNKID